MKIGLQLYTLRGDYKTKEEFIEVLKKIRAMGIEGVEFAGFADIPAEEMKTILYEIGLLPLASHHSVDALENNLPAILAYLTAIGCKNIVCSFSPTATNEERERLERVMKATQGEASLAGLQTLYHNHSHEFTPAGAVRPIDRIKEYCLLELDTYWVFDSGVNVREYMLENARRIGLLHLKDGDRQSHPCAIGEGVNDIQGILDTAAEIGAQWLLLENDIPVPNGLSDVARSMENLRSRFTVRG